MTLNANTDTISHYLGDSFNSRKRELKTENYVKLVKEYNYMWIKDLNFFAFASCRGKGRGYYKQYKKTER